MSGSLGRALTLLLVAVAAGAGLSSGAEEGTAGRARYDEASRELLDSEVFTTPGTVTFEPPPALEGFTVGRKEAPRERRRKPRPEDGNGKQRSHRLGLGASMVFANDELGASKRIAGTGTGTQLDLLWRKDGGLGVSVSLTTVENGLYSDLDGADARLDRYAFGVSYPVLRRKRLSMTLGGGLAWSTVDVDSDDGRADVDGFGGFVDLGLSVGLGSRVDLTFLSRFYSWQGEDGLGNTGTEQSSAVSAGVEVRF